MRNNFNLSTIITSIFFAGILAANSFAQNPKTVTDFYLLMPGNKYSTNTQGKTIKGKAALTKFRKSLIKAEDIPNGYLRLEQPGKTWSEIAVFKKTDGSYIVGESVKLCRDCDFEVNFFSHKNGKWTKITNEVLPDFTEEQMKPLVEKNLSLEGLDNGFMMPRKDRTLRMFCGDCRTNDGLPFVYGEKESFKSEVDGKMKYVIFSWNWNGESFVLNQD